VLLKKIKHDMQLSVFTFLFFCLVSHWCAYWFFVQRR